MTDSREQMRKACLYKEHATCVLWIKGGGGNTRL